MISIKTKSDFTVRLANENDTLSIRNIWRECFTSDISYIDNFITNCFPHAKTWVAISNKSSEIVSILSLLPTYFNYDGKNFTGGYIYGVATLPDFRGNSLSKVLMNAAFEYSGAINLQYLVVKPANDSLFDLYRGQSFDILINKDIISVNLASDNYFDPALPMMAKNQLSLQDNKSKYFADNIEKLLNLREIDKPGSKLLWPSAILRYALLDIKNKGGNLHFISETDIDRELYYIEQPDEDDSAIIKVVDCNYKEKRDIYTIISHIKSLDKKVKTVIFEGNFQHLSPIPFPILRTKSALIKILDNKLDHKLISKIHLSLSME